MNDQSNIFDDLCNELEPFDLDRRDFLKALGGGVFVLFSLGEDTLAQRRRRRVRYPEDFNAYLHIKEDGRVSCFTGKIEMGQGIITSLALMLAEELDVSPDMVDMVMGDTDLCPWDMGTFGSMSTKYFGPALRQAAAEARAVLLQLATDHLKLPVTQLSVKDGVVFTKNNPAKNITYQALTKGKRIEKHFKVKPSIKHVSKHTVSGKAVNRSDALEKVTGKAKYTSDYVLPGMLHAKILRPPVHGAVLKSVDTSAAYGIKGAKVIRDDDLIAVLHHYPDIAEKALALIKVEFRPVSGLTINNDTIFKHLLKVAPTGIVDWQEGDLQQGKKQSVKTCNGKFFNHYVAHACMETHTALAKFDGNKVTVWASTQTPFRAKDAVAKTLQLSPKNVRIITPFVGGGYGGKSGTQQIVEAVRLAKLAEKPVQVSWSRQEEFFYDTFRPAAVIDIQAGIDAGGKIVSWDYMNYFAGSRSSRPFYNIPHFRVSSTGGWRGAKGTHPFRTGAWRGPGSNTNVFAMESLVDMLAEEADMDPLSFRLLNLKDKRMKKVLESAAHLFGRKFSKKPGGNGSGYGIACTDYLGTYVTAMAEVIVNKETGKIKVERIVCAQDTGEIINPEGIKMQIEGGIIMGLGYVLSEKINFRGGDVLDKNFDTYPLPRFSWLPKIETQLMDNPSMPPQGCGEAAITTMGAVIANAVYDAIGVRFFELPITPENIKKTNLASMEKS